jgi:hypothetical protein
MRPKKPLVPGNKILVKSFAGPDVHVTLKNRYIAAESKLKLGVDGWEAQIKDNKEVEKLRKAGVPYEKGSIPSVWVFDWQII